MSYGEKFRLHPPPNLQSKRVLVLWVAQVAKSRGLGSCPGLPGMKQRREDTSRQGLW